MRRCAVPVRYAPKLVATLALLGLAGCNYASSPLVGAGGFLGDTHGFAFNPNQPPGSSENFRRAAGQDFDLPPLTTEPGNVWPGPVPPEPTLTDLQRSQNNAPPLATEAPYAPHPQPRPVQPPAPGTAPAPGAGVSPPRAPVLNTPSGTLVPNNSTGSGVTTAIAPGGGTSIIIPNGNGTSTVIAPDGTTQTVPSAR